MKKLLLTTACLASLFAGAQEAGHLASKGTPAQKPAYSNDIVIENAPTTDQRRVRIGVAFNGWVYAAYNTYNASTNSGGITIRMSRNNGASWTTIDNYSVPSVTYPAHDIVVAGTDTNNLTLYVAGVNHNVSSNSYVLYVDRYNATTGTFSGSNFNQSNGTRTIYDVALASDYRFPAVGASPYSLGMLYSTYSSTYDSVCFVGSVDGGASWTVRQPVAQTGSFFRNVSLAYGRSSSASNGRYFGAWEQLSSSTARVGHIYTSRSSSQVTSSWIAPRNLDSVSSSMINLCRNPQIAVSYNNTDNDSASVTAVVVVARDYAGDGSDYDILGFYNKRAHYTNFWNRFDVVNSGEVDMQPDVTFDPGYNNFLLTYYDSTNSKLPYVVNGFNFQTPNTWATITPQYNDVSTNLKAPWPRVEINPAVTKVAHAWIAEGTGSQGVAMFDAEYNMTGIHELKGGNAMHELYPNPAVSQTTLRFYLDLPSDVVLQVYDAYGKLVSVKDLGKLGDGLHDEQFDVKEWPAGVYTYTIKTGNRTMSNSFVVTH